MAFEDAQLAPRIGVPEADGAIVIGNRQATSVGRKSEGHPVAEVLQPPPMQVLRAWDRDDARAVDGHDRPGSGRARRQHLMHVGLGEIGIGEAGATQVGACDCSALQRCAAQVHAIQVRIVQFGACQVRTDEGSVGRPRAAPTGAVQAGAVQVGIVDAVIVLMSFF